MGWRDRWRERGSSETILRDLARGERGFVERGTDHQPGRSWGRPDGAAPGSTEATEPRSAAVTPAAERAPEPAPPISQPDLWGSPSEERAGPGTGATAPTSSPRTSAPPSTAAATPPTSRGKASTQAGTAGAAAPTPKRSRWVAGLVVATVVGAVLAVVLARGEVFGPGEVDRAWRIEPGQLEDGYYGSFTSVDGTEGSLGIATPEGWLVLAHSRVSGTYDEGSRLALLSPSSGAPVWVTSTPRPVRCALSAAGGVTCLAETGRAEGMTLLDLDTENGQLVPVAEVELAETPRMLLPFGLDWLVLTEESGLSRISPEGEILWSERVGLQRWDPRYDDITAAPLDSGALLQIGTRNTVHVPADGGARVRSCDRVAATAQAWACQSNDDDESHGFGLDGEQLWALDRSEGRILGTYGRISPLIAATGTHSIQVVEAATGQLGPDTPVAIGAPVALTGTAAHPVLITRGEGVALLSPAGDRLLWEVPVPGTDYLSIATTVALADTLVLDADPIYGFDLATGEEHWSYAWVPGDLFGLDGALLVHNSSYIERLDP